MKVLVISDIHSNAHALEAVLAAESDADQIFCAGDLVDYGPYPRDVLDIVRNMGIPCVSGNHDERVVAFAHDRGSWAGLHPDERHWVHQNVEALRPDDIEFLAALPESVEFFADGHAYHMRHRGASGYELIQLVAEFEQHWSGGRSPNQGSGLTARVIVGHTHIQAIHHVSEQRLWLNPGSVSYRSTRQQLDLTQDAQYITIVDGSIAFQRRAYDRTRVFLFTQKLALTTKEREFGHRFFAPDS